MLVRLTKLKDEIFNGQHPNGINEGAVREGRMLHNPVVGEPFVLIKGTTGIFHTSTVTEIIDDETFRTMNSIYKIQILEKMPKTVIHADVLDDMIKEAKLPKLNNSIFILAPYKFHGQWVFDDERVGLVREAFVAGADTTLDLLSNNADKCVINFSTNPFKGHQIMLELERTDPTGSDYVWGDSNGNIHEVWLCPALFLYYPQAPTCIYLQVKTDSNGNSKEIQN